MYEITFTRRDINKEAVYLKVQRLQEAQTELEWVDGLLKLARLNAEKNDDYFSRYENLVDRAVELIDKIDYIEDWLDKYGITLREID